MGKEKGKRPSLRIKGVKMGQKKKSLLSTSNPTDRKSTNSDEENKFQGIVLYTTVALIMFYRIRR